MANPLDLMDIRQIIISHLDGESNRQIAKTLGIHRNTINTYIQHITSCDWPMEELLKMSDAALRNLFPTLTTIKNPRYDELMVYFEQIKMAKEHPGFTFLIHYNEYKEQAKEPYSYTQFMEHYKRRYANEKGSGKLNHEAGKELFVDFAGKKLHIVNRETGEKIPVEVFVAIFPHSGYTYVRACMSQKREDFIESMTHALSFFQGVPKAIVSDNLKTAVTRASKYEPVINKTFKDFARHYNCVINPTRTYSAQDKALVENAVNLSYQRIYYPIREMTFFSLEDLNKTILSFLDRYNDLLFQRKDTSRKELFQSVERQYLKSLPSSRYELKDYRRAKVQKIGYVYFSPDKTYYSVPYRYIGKRTQVEYTKSRVEVYYNHERIAIHQRDPTKGSYITQKDHLSSTHRAYSEWSPEYFKNLARKHGEYVLAVVKGFLQENDYPEVAYKRAMGVIQLHKTYGSERLNNACKRAYSGEVYSYKMICNILKTKLDTQQLNLDGLHDDLPHIPQHENIRGANHYQ